MIRSLLFDYGPSFLVNRSLYAAKLALLRRAPRSAALFERRVQVRRVDLFSFDLEALRRSLAGLCTSAKEALVEAADAALAGRLNAFSSLPLSYGDPIDWQLNPITGRRADADRLWFQIPDFDRETGDIKAIWEASRLTHFWHFSRAYLLTGDARYYRGFAGQLRDWLEKNPYPYGANFKCGQECTLRMLNVLAAYAVFSQAGLAEKADEAAVFELVSRCYRKVLSNFFYAHRCIHNNHTFTELCGMIAGAWCADDARRTRKAYRMLEREIRRQFLPDGGYNQYSFTYQRFTLQVLGCVHKLGERTGLSLSRDASRRIADSARLLFDCQDGGFDVPNYGANDGSLIFPVTACGYRDFRPAIQMAHALFGGQPLYPPGPHDEALLWFGQGLPHRTSVAERRPAAGRRSGFYTLRHAEGFLMIVLHRFRTRPGHMDQLHVDLWHQGLNVLCDAGTYSYAEPLGAALSGTGAHNTAKVEGIEQMNKRGAFLVTDWTRASDATHTEASFAGTMVSRNGYTHRREVRRQGDAYAIADTVWTDGRPYQLRFHTPLDCAVRGRDVMLRDGEQTIATLRFDGAGAIAVEPASRSLYYYRTEPSRCVCVSFPASQAGLPSSVEIRLGGAGSSAEGGL